MDQPFIAYQPPNPTRPTYTPIPSADSLRAEFFKPGDHPTALFCVNTIDLTTGHIRSAWDTNNSKPKMIERKGQHHLYPYQIWLLKVADDEVLGKHKDVIKSDYESCFKMSRQSAGYMEAHAATEAKNGMEKVIKDAKDEVEGLKMMVKHMNEFLPAVMGFDQGMWEQRMYAEARRIGKFGR